MSAVSNIRRFLRLGALVLCVLIVSFVLLAINSGAPPRPRVTITFNGFTNQPDGSRLAMLALDNQGENSLWRDQYYTVTWTNSSGMATNLFVSLRTNVLIRPGQSEVVLVKPPSDPGPWFTLFSFYLVTNQFQRALGEIHEWMPSFPIRQSQRLEHLFTFIGPTISSASGTNRPEGDIRSAK